MGKLIIILFLACPVLCIGQCHTFTADDLLKLSSLSSKSFDDYLEKKGFSVKRRSLRDNQMGFSFFENKKTDIKDTLPAISRRIDLYKKTDSWYIKFHTSSPDEYAAERSRLKQMNFFWTGKDTSLSAPLLFQKQTVSVQIGKDSSDSDLGFTIVLKKKEMPDPASVQYAEDLLGFDSHEYLVSFFGESNVKREKYYFSETESKQCSVLFPNTSDQAVFIWDDETNYRKLSYILISGLISTRGAVKYSGSFGQNRWMLKNGIYPGMRIGDLLKLNANDFEFYGKESEYTYMVEPKVTGNINFKWIGVMLNCFNCDRSEIMEGVKVKATDAVKSDLALHVSYIMIRP